jgi:uncharacterized protein (UPF0332 family)
MSLEKANNIAKRIAVAKKTLQEVDILVENELWNTAVNRLYYACFYAVTALLHKYDMDTKTHGGTQTIFGLHFVKPDIINKESGRFYSKLFVMRQNADYEYEVEYEREDVLPLIQPSVEFVSAIEVVLSRD